MQAEIDVISDQRRELYRHRHQSGRGDDSIVDGEIETANKRLRALRLEYKLCGHIENAMPTLCQHGDSARRQPGEPEQASLKEVS